MTGSDLTRTAPLGLGIVGCGGSRQAYGPILQMIPDLRVVGLMDVDPVSARLWAKQLGRPEVHSELSDLLADPDVDAVLLASPVSVRAEQAIAAARAGKHLYCEPPMAVAVAECDAMIAAAADNNVRIVCAFPKRFERTFLLARDVLDGKEIGDVTHLRCDWTFYSGWSARKESLRTWHGVFDEHAGQTVDVSRWWLGEVLSVSADVDLGAGSHRSSHQGNIILQHERGVSVHHIARTDHKGPVEQYLVTGSTGELQLSFGPGWSRDSLEYFRVVKHTYGQAAADLTPEPLARAADEILAHHPRLCALRHFAESVRTGAPPSVSGRGGGQAVETLLAARVSSLEKTKVALPLARSEYLAAMEKRVDEATMK